MTPIEIDELKELRVEHEAMLRHPGRPWNPKIHDDYVKLLLYHAEYLIKAADALKRSERTP